MPRGKENHEPWRLSLRPDLALCVPVCGHQGPEARCQAPRGNTGSSVTSGDSPGQEVTTERNSQEAAQEAAGAGSHGHGKWWMQILHFWGMMLYGLVPFMLDDTDHLQII